MTPVEFLAYLRERNVSLRLVGDKLHADGPKQALTSELREQLRQRKRELVELLKGSLAAPAPRLEALAPAERTEPQPLSAGQRRLWFLQQLSPGSAAYTFPLAIRLKGRLEVEALQRALGEIVQRHDVLRVVFVSPDGDPRQKATPFSPIQLAVDDLSQLPPEQREEEARRKTGNLLREPFDLARGPLHRFGLLRLAQEEHVFLCAIHHIVFDGWSFGILLRELAALYGAFVRGQPSPLPAPRFQYVDYARWQAGTWRSQSRQAELAYWTERLAGSPPVLELPKDRARPTVQESHGAHCVATLTPALSAQIRALCQQEGVSLFMGLLAAFQVLLHRLSGQEDFLLGTPVAGRFLRETEDLIGFFVNTIVMRADFSRPLTFRELLNQVRESTLSANAHQEMPFEDLLEALDPKRDLNRTPLFQVFFNHLNLDMPAVELEGLAAEPFGDPMVDSKFDLTLYVNERAGAIELLLVYTPDLFTAARMEGFLQQYICLLEQACGAPARLVTEYSMLVSARQGELPNPAAPLESVWCGSVIDQLAGHTARQGNRVLVSDATGSWSYAEFDQLSIRLADWLRRNGVGPGVVVAVLARRCAPLLLAVTGVIRSGGAFCLLDAGHPTARLVACVQAARPQAWLEVGEGPESPEELRRVVAEHCGGRRLVLPDTRHCGEVLPEAGEGLAEVPVEPDRLAYVTFTSGTTGGPKCIHGSHRPLAHFLDWHCSQFGLNATDRFSALSGLGHDPLLRDLLTPLWCGATLCVPAPDDILAPGRLFEWMGEQQITVSHMPPAVSVLLSEGGRGFAEKHGEVRLLKDLRYVFLGGDAVTPRDLDLIRDVAPAAQTVTFYGATETPQAMGWYLADHAVAPSPGDLPALARPLPIGRGIRNVQLLVLNAARRLSGIGEPGEICIRTPFLALGYANDEALTKERFVTNPATGDPKDRYYRTGDRGRYAPGGMVEFMGRLDYQIKIRGYRIEPGEIEAALSTHPSVRDCVVVPQGSGAMEKRLVAYVAADRGERLSPDALRAQLAKVLPDYMIPAAFVLLPALPLTPNGKVDRAALPPAGEVGPAADAGYVPPRNKVERVLAQTWAEILQVPKVGVFDGFFELGGHSLSAARLVARLRSVLSIDLPLRSIFQEPTVAGLARQIHYDPLKGAFEYMSEAPRWRCLVPIQTKGSRPPLFLVAGAHADEDTFLRYLSNMIPHLGLDQPVYGFKPRGLDGRERAHTSVEEMAHDYLAELRAFQPEGPYRIAGECVGGVVAFEMAQQLVARGEQVALLVLLDTARPTFVAGASSRVRHMVRRGIRSSRMLLKIAAGGPREWLRGGRALLRTKAGHALPRTPEQEVMARIREVEFGYPRMIFRYRARPYPGSMDLIVNSRHYRWYSRMGWGGMARGGLQVHRVPGDHITRLTQHGRELAACLLGCLDRVLARSGSAARDGTKPQP